MLDFLAGSNALSAIMAFGLVLVPAILIHETGHFVAARLVGIAILEFGIGFPPRAFTLGRRNGTVFTLNWLPFGGFVRPLGEGLLHRDRPEEPLAAPNRPLPDPETGRHRPAKQFALHEAPPLARIVFMAAGSAANLLTALLLLVLVGLTGLPSILGASAGIVGIDQAPGTSATGLRVDDRILKLDDEYFAGVPELLARLQARAGDPLRLEVQREDGIGEMVLEFDDADMASRIYIVHVAPDSPAALAGLAPGDLVHAFNRRPLGDYADLQLLTREHRGEMISLTVQRAGEELEISLIPRSNPPEGEGAIGIGIMPAWRVGGLTLVEAGWQEGMIQLPLSEAPGYALEQLGLFIRTLIELPAQLIAGTLRPEEARLMSPLAISQVGGQFLQDSIESSQPYIILGFMALISIALGITNLLPLPALDGGRILFVLVELVRGQPVAPEREGLVHLLGMALLFSLMLVTLVNDVLNPVTVHLP